MGAALGLAFALVYLLMVALFNSYRSPAIILFAVPLAVIGALGALAITRETLNLFSLIGMVLLIGLVVKNGILLVDFANRERDAGKSKLAAIVSAAETRFRPIVMTTIAMIAGMTPLALALDPGTAVRQSLGVVVIGGLSSSLLLTLVIVPIAYLWISPKHLKRSHGLDDGVSSALGPAAAADAGRCDALRDVERSAAIAAGRACSSLGDGRKLRRGIQYIPGINRFVRAQ